MFAEQWKGDEVMIEAHPILPGLFAVALLTGAPQLAVVFVVLGVAGIAVQRQLFVFRSHRVTLGTINLRMMSA